MREPPEILKKKGIKTVSDNLQPGDVVLCGKAFNRIFRTELEQRIYRKTAAEANETKTKKSKSA